MIAAATDRRLAGDWRGACAAANVAVDIPDPRGRVLDDLEHLAPDLLRWHLPLTPRRLAHTGHRFPLALYPDGTALIVQFPSLGDQPQRLRLQHGPVPPAPQSWHTVRERWDARRAADVLYRCGGDDRLPFFTRTAEPSPTPATVTERVLAHYDRGEIAEAWHAAGFELESPEATASRMKVVSNFRPNLTILAAEARRLGDTVAVHAARSATFALDRLDTPNPRVRVIPDLGHGLPELPHPPVTFPSFLVDLREGTLDPLQLHPLVGAAVFSVPTMPGPVSPFPPVTIRCGNERHEVRMADGALVVPHPPESVARELTLAALGGRVEGCAAAAQAWRSWTDSLPEPLRSHRRMLLALVEHGESAALESLLDAGIDPYVRDHEGRTLLHRLPWLFPEEAQLRLLPRLLAAGLSPTARSRFGATPLQEAVTHGAPAALREALLAAGADPADLTPQSPAR